MLDNYTLFWVILSIVLLAIIKSKTWGSWYKVSLPASSAAMEYWAWQCVKSVEVIAPKSLGEKIKETLKSSAKKYDEFYKIKNL